MAPLAPYGSTSLKGALKNIKMLLQAFIAAPSHFPPSVFHMVYAARLGSCTHRPLIMSAAGHPQDKELELTSVNGKGLQSL